MGAQAGKARKSTCSFPDVGLVQLFIEIKKERKDDSFTDPEPETNSYTSLSSDEGEDDDLVGEEEGEGEEEGGEPPEVILPHFDEYEARYPIGEEEDEGEGEGGEPLEARLPHFDEHEAENEASGNDKGGVSDNGEGPSTFGDEVVGYRFTANPTLDKDHRKVTALGQNTSYAGILLDRQFRTGVFSLSVSGNSVRFLRWD